jgi:hypothetical protein
MESQNTKIVQDAYAAFTRGDIATLLGLMADDIVWQPVIGAASHVPFSASRSGKPAVAEFFQQVATSEDFTQFEPREYITQGNDVVAIGHYRAVVKATGKSFDSDFAMAFTLKDGKIVRFREFTDSASVNAAYS